MELRCQHCGELIVARGFGKCPACFSELPEDLKLTEKEVEAEMLEAKWRKLDYELYGSDLRVGDDGTV